MNPLIAATATHEPGGLPWWAWIALGALGVALVKVGQWWWRPFAACLCCQGSGRHSRKDGRVFRDCWWCKGSGRRLRIGRRVWNRFARIRKASA